MKSKINNYGIIVYDMSVSEKTIEKKPLVLMTSFVQNYLLRLINKN